MRSIARADRPAADRWLARGLALLVALAVCAPLLGRGYTLAYDMVFVPDPAFTAHAWGGDGMVPRAVPADAILAVVGWLLPMSLVQQLLLLAATGLGVLGAWRVAPARTLLGAAATALAFGWGAYQAERLAMGQWSLLLGVALLPWVLRAGLGAADTGRAWQLALLVAAGAVAAPTAGVLTAGLALALVAALPLSGRHRALVVATAGVANATWAVPGALAGARLGRDDLGVAAFATAADTPAGVVVSALTGGGVWNRLVHLDSRASAVSAGLGLVVLAVAALGVRALVTRPATATRASDPVGPAPAPASARAGRAVLALGIIGLLLALVTTTGPGAHAVTWLTGHVPGAGLLRDAQKWLGWWLLPVALAFGVGLERVAAWFPPGSAVLVLASGALVPLVATPDYAWGVGGRLEAHPWPAAYSEAARALDEAPRPGAVVVLPWHAFRAWDWNGDRAVLDPWQRWLDRPVVVRDDLELVHRTVPGEDPVAAAVGEVLGRGGPVDTEALRALGVRYVLEDLTTAGREGPEPAGSVLVDNDRVRVVDLGPVEADPARDAHPVRVAGADLVALVWVLGLVIGGAVSRWRNGRSRVLLSR
ncbi:hypothetical protein [Nocardioides sp.]|uniref:hypothetical protein n=1 Tax=Nocardioides sp. TaxID=35761 RepID=UPI0035279433